MSTLAMWTVYDHPDDYPDKFIARRFEVGDDGGVLATTSVIVADSIETIRDILQFELHFVMLMRSPEDDPKIVETWL